MRQWLSGLAPRRRALIVSLLAVIVLAATGVTVGLVASHHATGQDPGTVGAGGQDPGPVILVPGYGGSRNSLDRLAARIRTTGRTAVVVKLPGDGTGDLVAQARVLQTTVAAQLRAGAGSVDVIGYSAGGVVVRLWLADFGGSTEARRVVSLGSPLHGAQIAAVGQAFVPSACPIACQQLAPGSALLRSLETHPLATPWMSIWTTDDQTVDPPDSARLSGAVNVIAQAVCPDAVISHGQLPTDSLVTGIVLNAIGSGPLVSPTSSDCVPLRSSGES